MGKKNKKEKDDLKVKDPEKVEDGDKVSIKKTFRDTGIIMGAIAAVVGILIFATKDAVYIEGEENKNNPIDEEIVGDPDIAYENLVKLANKELIDVRGLTSSVNYVSGLLSVELSTSKVVFCGVGDLVDGVSFIVKVEMLHGFRDEDEFVYQMTALNMNSNVVMTYGISATAMEINSDPDVRDKLFDNLEGTLSKYDSDKQFLFNAYNTTDGIFWAGTYGGKDGSIYSTNEMRYNDSTNDYTVTSEYGISPSKNAKMYSLLEKIIA